MIQSRIAPKTSVAQLHNFFFLEPIKLSAQYPTSQGPTSPTRIHNRCGGPVLSHSEHGSQGKRHGLKTLSLAPLGFPSPPPSPAAQDSAGPIPAAAANAAATQRGAGAMAVPEAPSCYVGIARQSAAFRLMKQMVCDPVPSSCNLSI